MSYYLAYGSNLSLEQMARRCSDAYPVGTCFIPGYLPCFKGSGSGAYLTIEEGLDYRQGGTPCLVWEISSADEARLDAYEGYPLFYYKKTFTVDVQPFIPGPDQPDPVTVEAMAYIMHEERRFGIPSKVYMGICLEGYHRFGFDSTLLFDAEDYSASHLKKGGVRR